jgi:hypothetical protein
MLDTVVYFCAECGESRTVEVAPVTLQVICPECNTPWRCGPRVAVTLMQVSPVGHADPTADAPRKLAL